MNNIYVWLSIGIISVTFGILSKIPTRKHEIYKDMGVILWFFDVWRDFVNYFITGVIGYFFIAIRWPNIIAQSGILSISDFFVCLAFLIGACGAWPYLIKYSVDGTNNLFGRIFSK